MSRQTTTDREVAMPAVTVLNIEPRDIASAASLVFDRPASARSGIAAKVEVDGFVLHLSKMDGEDRWIVDGKTRKANGFPVFMNGFGSRCTILVPASAEVADALDHAADR